MNKDFKLGQAAWWGYDTVHHALNCEQMAWQIENVDQFTKGWHYENQYQIGNYEYADKLLYDSLED